MTRAIQESYIVQFFMRIWAFVTENWPKSACARGLDRFGAWVSRSIKGSAVCRFLMRDGVISRSWPESFLCRAITAVINFPGAVCRLVYRAGKGLWDGSLFGRGLAVIGGWFVLPLGVFLLVMLVVPHESWDNRYALMGAAALLALFIVSNSSRQEVRLETGRLSFYFVLYLGFVFLSFATSLSRSDSVRFVAFYLILFILVLLTVSSVREYRQLQLLLAFVVAGLTIASIYGCYQALIGVEVNPTQQDMMLNAGMPGRIYSFFDNPNNFAEILVMFTPFALALFLNAEGWRGKTASLFALVMCLLALLVTYSRSGYLGIVLVVMVFLLFENWKLIPLMLVLGMCFVPLLPETVFKRILTIGNTSDTSTSYRFAIFKATTVLLEDYWLKGVGLGSDVLKTTFENYPRMFDGNVPIHTHNNYLQVWAETGIFGLLAFLATILSQVKYGIKAYQTAADKKLRRVLAAAMAGFVGILFISIAEYTWFYPRNMFFYWFLFAVILTCGKLAKEQTA